MIIPRRRFVKFLTIGTATSAAMGRLWQRELLAFCVPSPDQSEGSFKVRLSDYPGLQAPFGSVRLGINPVGTDHFPIGNFWPILITRDEDGFIHVLDGECRHASCVVRPYDASAPGIRCPCHGSRYNIDGTVLEGPATVALRKYPFEFDGQDTLTIHVPCWGFSTQLSVLAGGASARLQLDFPTFQQVTYEVQFRPSLSEAWTVVPFATTPDGLADQSSLLGVGVPATVYVDRTSASGFYAVSMILSEA